MAPFHLLATSFLSVSRRGETTALCNNNKLMDEDEKCIFGKKEYWDSMYEGEADRPGDQYSWYCGWDELAPFWRELVPNQQKRVLIAGMGNDPTPVDIFDEGYTHLTAYDYSQAGIDRAKELFGSRRAKLLTADARDLHTIETGSIDATLDKGTLDAIYITGVANFRDAVQEMARVTSTEGGIVVCISRVVYETELLRAFDSAWWENVHDGGLAFAPDGEATIDLGAELYSWRRTSKPWTG